MIMERDMRDTVDAVVVGAGFAGLYALHRLRGLGLSTRVFEAGSGVGGTWFWNRYPGARCDVESLDYQYAFSPELLDEWRWSERYPRQGEILAYLEHVADRFALRPDIELNTRVSGAAFDEETSRWEVETEAGGHVSARFLIMATGCLSAARVPDLPGLDSFAGRWFHTGSWPHEEVDFTGQRVAVVGTGSSGVQSIPVIAQQADQLVVFQRTPSFSVPAVNEPLDVEAARRQHGTPMQRRARARVSIGGLPYPEHEGSALEMSDEERTRHLEERSRMGGLAMYGAFSDVMVDQDANAAVVAFFHDKIRERVDDPAVAERLLPRDYPFGTKRVCVDTGYYETFNRDNVTIVDVRQSPIEEITPRGLRVGGVEHEVDAIVFATGFDAMTGAVTAVDLRGRAGASLAQKWSAGPRTYLGLAVAGFPNLFLVTGPGSPSVLSNMVVSIEQHVDWIADAIAHVRDSGAACIEATVAGEDAWVDHVDEVASSTLVHRANSWYLGANVPGKPRVFMPYMGGVGPYAQRCDEEARGGYAGFALTPTDRR
jgi:cyclohexanone monooxygenase